MRFGFTLCVRARVRVCVYRSRGSQVLSLGSSPCDVEEALVVRIDVLGAKSKKIRKNKKRGVCYLSGGALLLLAFLRLAL